MLKVKVEEFISFQNA